MNPYELLERTQWDFFWVPQIPNASVVDRPEIAYVHGPHPMPYVNVVSRTRAPKDRLHHLIDEVLAAHAGVHVAVADDRNLRRRARARRLA